MKTIYAVLLFVCANVIVNAMQFMQAPPPPPPDPESGGIGGNNVPIDSIAPFLIVTFLTIVVWFVYRSRKSLS